MILFIELCSFLKQKCIYIVMFTKDLGREKNITNPIAWNSTSPKNCSLILKDWLWRWMHIVIHGTLWVASTTLKIYVLIFVKEARLRARQNLLYVVLNLVTMASSSPRTWRDLFAKPLGFVLVNEWLDHVQYDAPPSCTWCMTCENGTNLIVLEAFILEDGRFKVTWFGHNHVVHQGNPNLEHPTTQGGKVFYYIQPFEPHPHPIMNEWHLSICQNDDCG